MGKLIKGLLGGSKPVLVMTALVAVVGVTGTAYAGKHLSGNGSKGDRKDTQTAPPATDNHPGNWNHKGRKGARGAQYGVAIVNVSRGGAAPTAWATYSTALGSPVGDTTGGVFRFTCSTANAPCKVSVSAAILSGSHGTASVYPRVLIYKQDYNAGGPEVYCEYGDGSTGVAPLAIAKQPLTSTPSYTAVPLNIGGSDDCGLAGPAGDVSQITVPAGYYDVNSTFLFLS